MHALYPESMPERGIWDIGTGVQIYLASLPNYVFIVLINNYRRAHSIGAPEGCSRLACLTRLWQACLHPVIDSSLLAHRIRFLVSHRFPGACEALSILNVMILPCSVVSFKEDFQEAVVKRDRCHIHFHFSFYAKPTI